MPIKDKSAYPADWELVSYRIRLRANDRCEECGVSNGAMIHRLKSDLEQYVTHLDYKHLTRGVRAWYRSSAIKVVLTVAHLDNDTTNNDESNLKALCQLHHLRLDAAYHAQNAKNTRNAKKQAKIKNSGQLELFSPNDAGTAVFSRSEGNFAEAQDGS